MLKFCILVDILPWYSKFKLVFIFIFQKLCNLNIDKLNYVEIEKVNIVLNINYKILDVMNVVRIKLLSVYYQ